MGKFFGFEKKLEKIYRGYLEQYDYISNFLEIFEIVIKIIGVELVVEELYSEQRYYYNNKKINEVGFCVVIRTSIKNRMLSGKRKLYRRIFSMIFLI